MSGRIRARLDAIQARAEAATPGPWEVQEPGGWATISSGPDSVFHAYSEEIACACGDPVDGPPQVAIGIEDAEFIAAAREDVPALLGFARDVLALADEYAKPAAHRSHGGLVPVNRLRALAAHRLAGGSDD